MSQGRRRIGLLAALVACVGVFTLAVALLIREPPTSGDARDAESPGSEPSASHDEPPDVEPPDPNAMPWDAADWELVEGALPPDPGVLFRIDGMTAADGQLVAWGRVPMEGRNQFNDMGAVFSSFDGRTWQATSVEHGVNPLSTSTILGVSAGPGGFLAFGDVCCDPEAPAVWGSGDLEAWTRIELEITSGPADFHPMSIAGTAAGWVAIGTFHRTAGNGIWTSTDGAAWDLVMTVEDGPPSMGIADIAVTRDGLIAVGTVTGDDGTYDGAIWTSVDGREWERVADADPALVGEGETHLMSVVAHANGFYVHGLQETTEDRKACESLGSLTPVEAGPPPPATSCARGPELGWVSEDGLEWERVDPSEAAGEHPIEFRLIEAGGPGLVLLGESSGEASPDTNLFTSPDGREWTLVEPQLPVDDDVALGMAFLGDELVVIADAYSDVPAHPQWAVWVATPR